VAYHT
ncbi:mCG146488, partial [Mus musculus]